MLPVIVRRFDDEGADARIRRAAAPSPFPSAGSLVVPHSESDDEYLTACRCRYNAHNVREVRMSMMRLFLVALLLFTFACGEVVIETDPRATNNGGGGAGGDEVASTTTTETTSVGVGGSGGEGGGPECVDDEGCAVHNTDCYIFQCLSEVCFGYERDDDGDGYSSCGGVSPGSYDCADQDPSIHPDASETCNDMVDSDCDGGDNNGCATYCDPWSNPAETFGYKGCCGSYANQVAPIMPGTVFKAEGLESVYYFASDGKRYFVPSSFVLDSWWGAVGQNGVPIESPEICETIVQIDVALVAQIQLGGNVPLRPGVFVTGIASDATRYVVESGSVVRPLASDAVGDAIYPGTYGARVRLLPDAIFVTYFMGAPVNDPAEYDLAAALATQLEQAIGVAP